MEYTIDNNNISLSFDKIARELLTKRFLSANNIDFEITEIEFYYYHEKFHEDNYTHPHKRKAGEWRFHNQGIDITFEGSDIQDGGILIRGLKVQNEYINGPRKIIQKIFESFNSVSEKNILILKETIEKPKEIIKTFRHLPNKIQDKKFHNNHYRYLTNLNDLEIPKTIKERIKKNSIIL